MPTRRGVGSVGLLVAFLLGSLATAGAGSSPGLVGRAHAAKPRIAVVGVSADQLSSEVRAKLDAAVAGGLAASGADVVDSTTTARRIATKGLGGCETSTCRVAIAEVTGAAYLVRGSVESMGRSYTVRLEMIDGATGNVIGAREDRCDICTESEAYETASVTASALKAEVIKRPGAPASAGAGAGDDAKGGGPATPAARAVAGTELPAPGAPHESATVLVRTPGNEAPAESAPRFRALGLAGVISGPVAIAAGIFLIRLHGKRTCSGYPTMNCRDEINTQLGGYALTAGGVLATALGATLLIGRF
jgi:hypothetical protein